MTTQRRRATADLFARAGATDDAERRAQILGEVVLVNAPVARTIARRYRNRGCDLDDLEQAACLALVTAVHAYDPTSGHDFLSFAVPSIRGAVRRYFRDVGWMVRPPRSVQELQPRITAEQLRPDPVTGRPATVEELAQRLGVPPAHVREAQQARGCFAPTSLNAPRPGATQGELGDALGDDTDPGYGGVETRLVLGSVLPHLSCRDRSILVLRFEHDLSQKEIADRLGLTQTRVSRHLTRILGELRLLLGSAA